jgi:hypothetical protein
VGVAPNGTSNTLESCLVIHCLDEMELATTRQSWLSVTLSRWLSTTPFLKLVLDPGFRYLHVSGTINDTASVVDFLIDPT